MCTVNSLVSEHPCCSAKLSLTRGGPLWEKSKNKPKTELMNYNCIKLIAKIRHLTNATFTKTNLFLVFAIRIVRFVHALMRNVVL